RIEGVRTASAALYAPITGDSWNTGVRIEGRPEPPPRADNGAGWTRVTPGFFETIGAKILLGRPITDEDRGATRQVAVVNEAFAKRFFKDGNPEHGPHRLLVVPRHIPHVVRHSDDFVHAGILDLADAEM